MPLIHAMGKIFLGIALLVLTACTNDVDNHAIDISTTTQQLQTDKLLFRNGVAFIPGSNVPFTGVYAMNYPNGVKKIISHYAMGRHEGLTQEWHENGQKKIELNYKQGQMDGVIVGWNKKGQKTLELNYQLGKLVSSISNAKQLYKLNRFQEAFGVYQELAKQNNAQAEFYLGYMYNFGQGTNKNPELANFWFYRAARQISRKIKRS